MPKSTLHLIIQTREGIIYDGDILALTGKNNKGTFDILPMHGNFITLLGDTISITDINKKEFAFPIRNAIMRVSENDIDIFLGIRKL